MIATALSTALVTDLERLGTNADAAPEPIRLSPPHEEGSNVGPDLPSPMTDTRSTSRKKLASVLLLPRRPAPAREAFLALQRWEGIVVSVGHGEFDAELRDLTNPGQPVVDATLPVEEVSDEDRGLLKVGAYFYWTIGYDKSSGGRRRASEIRFRRLPAWTRSDIEKIKRNLEELDALLGERGV